MPEVPKEMMSEKEQAFQTACQQFEEFLIKSSEGTGITPEQTGELARLWKATAEAMTGMIVEKNDLLTRMAMALREARTIVTQLQNEKAIRESAIIHGKAKRW